MLMLHWAQGRGLYTPILLRSASPVSVVQIQATLDCCRLPRNGAWIYTSAGSQPTSHHLPAFSSANCLPSYTSKWPSYANVTDLLLGSAMAPAGQCNSHQPPLLYRWCRCVIWDICNTPGTVQWTYSLWFAPIDMFTSVYLHLPGNIIC